MTDSVPHRLPRGLLPRGEPTPPAAEPVDALIDASRMRAFRDDYPDIVDQLVDLFVQSTPPLLGELRAAHDAGDRDELRRAAHKLKGSCQSIGATFMATLCRSLETAEDGVEAMLTELDAAFAPTEAAIRQALNDARH
jgi:two-component system sensor histidine kinase/response regulator